MKKIAVLSSMLPLHTYETLDLSTENIRYDDCVDLVKAPGAMLWIIHASPLGRRLALPIMEHVDYVIILYNKKSQLSTLRARQWKAGTHTRKPVYYNIKLYKD